MMAIDQRQIDRAITSAPTDEQCRAIDKVLEERRRIARLRSAAANRVDDDSPWLVIRVSGNEISIRDEMLEAGIEALVPMKLGKEKRRRNEKIPAKPEPVLVGYILVRCDLSYDAIAGILSFDDVHNLLGSYEKPLLMSADKVRDFNRKAEEGEFDDQVPVSVFSRHRKVRVIEGPFTNYVGEIVTPVASKSSTAVVEIELFGRITPMIVSLAFLQPL